MLQWKISLSRIDKAFNKDCRVCQKHFEESDIIKGKTSIAADGTEIFVPHKWCLKQGAIPTLNLGSFNFIK